MIALGYYDGETDGLLTCAICGQPYYFTLVDWDEYQDVRIFSLTRLPRDEYEAMRNALEDAYGSMKKNYWLPTNPELSAETRDEVDAFLKQKLEQHPKPEAVLMTEHIEREILALHLSPANGFAPDIDFWRILRP